MSTGEPSCGAPVRSSNPMFGRSIVVLFVHTLNGVPSKCAPPRPAKSVARTPPSTPIGVAMASISGKRSSAFVKNAFWPMNDRYS